MIDERLNTYFNKFVPAEGKADTVAGEIVRALSMIGHRYYNDGDMVGKGYGNEMCNPAARYLIATLPREQGSLIARLWNISYGDDNAYTALFETAVTQTLNWLDKTDLSSVPNNDDMWNFATEEDEEWEEDEEDPDDDWDEE